MLRPGELTKGPLQWADLKFAARAKPSGSWVERTPWEAEVVLLRTRRKGAGAATILARWKSDDPGGLCPVEAAGALFHQELVRHAERDDGSELMADQPLFGRRGLTPQRLKAFVQACAAARGVPGCDAYSLRVGGAQHLGAHIRQHGDLHAAGGWAQGTGMAQHYAGTCIESTRLWSRLMVQPVGLLGVGGHGVAAPAFSL